MNNIPSAQPMAAFLHERLDGIADLPDDIHRAFAMLETADFQGGADWYALLCDTALAATEKPHLHVLRRDGVLCAALPLLGREPCAGGDLRALANFYTTRFTPFLGPDADPEGLATLFLALRSQQPRTSRIDFAPLAYPDRTYDLLRSGLRRAGFMTFDYFCFGNWYLPVTGDADAYLAARPGEVRSTLRRMTRRLSQAGGRVELMLPDGKVEGAIAAYARVYASSWKEPEPFADFMPALIRLCASKGWLRMGIVWIADKPVAVQLWVVANGKASIFKLAYDSAHANLSPGTVLTANLMRHVIDVDRVREVDYLTGDDAYKRAWMSHRRELRGIVGYDPRQLRGASLAARESVARILKQLLRLARRG